MKKLLLLFFAVMLFQVNAFSQTGVCNDFSSSTGMSQYPDPSSEVSYSVSGGELTITFTNAAFWADEVKWDFPSTIDISGIATPQITYEAAIVSLTINGTGTGCAAVNYLPLGMIVYDADGSYNTGTASTGYYQTTYVAGSNDIPGTPAAGVDYSMIQGIAIKPASFSATDCTPTSVSGSIKLKNLNVGTASCAPASVNTAKLNISSVSVYPNPAAGKANIELKMKQASDVKIVVVDMMGREVMQVAEGSFTELNKEINTSALQKGIYAVNVILNGNSAETKLLVVE